MGWLVIVAIKPVLAALDAWTLGWLLAGGLFYTLGTYFYHRESIRYSHAIWHLFVHRRQHLPLHRGDGAGAAHAD